MEGESWLIDSEKLMTVYLLQCIQFIFGKKITMKQKTCSETRL